MTQDNGLGDVTEKNILLASSSSEKIAATRHANGRDVWVTMHEVNNNTFRSYLITETGLSISPIICTIGTPVNEIDVRGQMKYSPDGTKLAMVLARSNVIELFAFDALIGKLTQPRKIEMFEPSPSTRLYGLEFSPDSQNLYCTEWLCHVFQINLAVEFKKENVVKVSNTPPCTLPSALQLAPDGKIYVAQFDKFFIGRINNPNAAGVLCDYTHLAIELDENPCSLGLPNFISSYFYDPELYPPKPYFIMPNVFTPNDDGFNDRLIPVTYLNIQSFRMIIFNRWGNKIFETSDAASGWDGSDSSPGVYYYKILYTGVNGEPGRVKGTVKLLR